MKVYQYEMASIDHPERCEDAAMTFVGDEDSAPVFAAIDGMGGHQRTLADGRVITGREAALIVRETLVEDLQHLPRDVSADPGGEAQTKAIAAIKRAHDRIRRELNDESEHPLNQRVGAVATVCVVCENGKRLLTAQVGDTRGYLVSGGELLQLCYDEDNIQYLVDQGQLSEEDGATLSEILNSYDGVNEPKLSGTVQIGGNPYELYIAWRWFLVGNTVLKIPAANIVIRTLGVYDDEPTPQVSRIELSEGDRLYLCSDGAYKNLTDAEMLAHILEAGDPAQAIGDAAYARSQSTENRRSTQDDITAVVVDLAG
ncbi:MAG: protein phosphatase 2C domain-containing protein [Chloroflexi bacterium]|uniref:PP2C family protein-serine/threonine phosphatase n=1 Tax=Candidatus Flexifilum breve TaxID=3140694 RepID=UPI003134BED7|nr:protein phosphatase 2C domain-containing protein [Chloroflexota bacterium]